MITICLLSYHPPGVIPSCEELEHGAKLNDDSYGFAAVVNGKLIAERGFDAGEMIDEYLSLKFDYPQSHAMFHSRKATDTSPTLENAHPFPVGRSGLAVVAHNGYFFRHAPGDKRTDSLVFAEEVLPRYNLDDPGERRLLEKRMGPNRAVVLSVSGHHERTAYVLGRDQGITTEDGAWHSNCTFLGIEPAGCRLCFTENVPMVVLPSGSSICKPCNKDLDTRRALLAEGPSATAWR